MSTIDQNPEQRDIDEIKYLLEDIRVLLERFINEDFERLAHPEFREEHGYLRGEILPIINYTINEAKGYIDHHRYDPPFKDGLRNAGCLGPQLRFKKWWFDKFKTIWNRIKNGPIQIARRFAGVLFDEMDSILGSLARIVPVLEPLIEIKEHLKNAVSAYEESSS